MKFKAILIIGAIIMGNAVVTANAQEQDMAPGQASDVPYLSDIPYVGRLFRQTNQRIESLSVRKKPEPLIITEVKIDAETYGEMIEDMSIMSRILDKTLVEVIGKDRREMVMGIVVSSLADKSLFQSVYLDGYGAMFTLNVEFPLVQTTEEPQADVEEPVKNEAWEAAKQELFASPSGSQIGGLSSNTNPEKNYDAAKVEQMKLSLLASLKNASNMRHLEADDKITVAVLSDRPKSAGPSEEAPAASRSVLMIQSTKADVDAVANGDLTDEKFIEKTSVSIY